MIVALLWSTGILVWILAVSIFFITVLYESTSNAPVSMSTKIWWIAMFLLVWTGFFLTIWGSRL